MAVVKNQQLAPMKATHDIQQVALALCVATNVTCIIWGPPGAGKTATLNAIAAANNLHLEQILASTKEPPDFAGFPFIDKGVMHLAPPAWAQNVINAYQQEKGKQISIAFFDELSTAVPATQAACLTTILDRKAGEAQMPMATRMIAAANPPKIAANGWDLTLPMANRFTHIDWELDSKTISEGLQTGWKSPVIPRLPKDIKSLIRKAEILVGAYIEKHPSAVNYDFSKFSGNSSTQEFRAANNAWPSARSWTTAAKLFAAATSATVDGKPIHSDVRRILLEGTVGVDKATEFLGYVEKLDLQNPIELLNNPQSFVLPDRDDKTTATLASVQHEAVGYKESKNYGRIWYAWGDIILAVLNAGKADVAFRFAQSWNDQRPTGVGMKQEHADAFDKLFKSFKKEGLLG